MKHSLHIACLLLAIIILSVFIGFRIAPSAGLEYGILVVLLASVVLMVSSGMWLLVATIRDIANLFLSHKAKTPGIENPEEAESIDSEHTGRSWHWITYAALWITIIGFFLFYPAISGPLRTDYRLELACESQLKRISAALREYHVRYGDFPPPYLVDENGKPSLSWRVLLLPFLDDDFKEAYNRIHLNESWDSPHNRKCFAEIKGLGNPFLCPAAFFVDGDRNETNYLMVLRPMLQGSRASTVDKETENAIDHEIFIVEVRKSGIHWAQPEDIDLENISGRFNEQDHLGIGSYHRRLAFYMLRDGEIQFFTYSMSPEEVRKLLGGGSSNDDTINKGG